MQNKLSKCIFISIVLHALLFTLFFLGSHLNWNVFNKKTTLIPSMRVDMVALPDLPSPSPQKKSKSSPLSQKKKKAVKLKLKEKKTIHKKQKEKAKKPLKKTTEKKEANKHSNKKTTTKQKGNIISEGSSQGKEQAQQIAINSYLIEVIEKIKFNWNLPKYLTDQNLYAQIEIKINDRGQLTEKKITVSSQNELFDSHVLKAIEQSAPFSPPPESVKQTIADGIVFTYKP